MSTFTIYPTAGTGARWRWKLATADGTVIARNHGGGRYWRGPVRDQVDAVRAEAPGASIEDLTESWVFAFGHGQRARSTSRDGSMGGAGIGVPLHNRYVVIPGDFATARRRMFAIFGDMWSMQYESRDEAGVAEFGSVEWDISDALAELARDEARDQ